MGRHRPGSDPTDLRLLRHRDGASALAVAVLCVAAAGGTLLPWYVASASVTVLDRTATTPLGTLAGWEAHPWTIVVVVLAAAGAAAAVLVAVDRPPEDGRRRILVAGLFLVAVGTVSVVVRPPATRFPVDAAALADLGAIEGPWPEGVEAVMTVTPTAAVVTVLVAGAALLLLALAHPGLRQ